MSDDCRLLGEVADDLGVVIGDLTDRLVREDFRVRVCC
jgi:hypothetical protein